MYEDTCYHCDRPIESEHGGPGAMWMGFSTLRGDGEIDWACDQHHVESVSRSAYGKHEPAVLPSEVEAAIESIRKDA